MFLKQVWPLRREKSWPRATQAANMFNTYSTIENNSRKPSLERKSYAGIAQAQHIKNIKMNRPTELFYAHCDRISPIIVAPSFDKLCTAAMASAISLAFSAKACCTLLRTSA